MEESRRVAMVSMRPQDVHPADPAHGACPVLPKNVGAIERAASVTLGAAGILCGIRHGGTSGLLLAGLGAAAVYRGLTGHCHGYDALGINTAEHPDATVIPAKQGVKFETSIRIAVPQDKLFAFWRDVENLPRVMRHLESVTSYDRDRSHWVARGPFGVVAAWDASVTQERENELIAWSSEPGSEVDTAGSVHFQSVEEGRATELTVSLKYDPPGGKIAAVVAKFLSGGLEAEIVEDLQRFKSAMERGETPSIDRSLAENGRTVSVSTYPGTS